MNRVAFCLLLGYIFTIPGEVLLESPIMGTSARIIGFVLALAWVAEVLVSKRIRRPTVFHLAALAFVAWNGLSVFWSSDTIRSAEHFGTWVQLLAASFIVWDLCTTRFRLLAALQAYVLGCWAIVASALANFQSNSMYYTGRFSATSINPNDFGILLAIGIPIAWYLTDSLNGLVTPLLQKPINYAFIAAGLFGIAISGSRAGLLAAVPGILFVLVSLARRSWGERLVIVLLFLAGLSYLYRFVPQVSIDRLSSTTSQIEGGDLNGRLNIWEQGLDSFRQHPFLGVGSDMFRYVNIEGKVAHNSALSILVEVGLIGLILYGLILLIVFTHAVRQAPWEAALWICILATWAIGASAHTWEYKKATWLIFALIVCASSLWVSVRQTEQASRSQGMDTLAVGQTP